MPIADELKTIKALVYKVTPGIHKVSNIHRNVINRVQCKTPVDSLVTEGLFQLRDIDILEI